METFAGTNERTNQGADGGYTMYFSFFLSLARDRVVLSFVTKVRTAANGIYERGGCGGERRRMEE